MATVTNAINLAVNLAINLPGIGSASGVSSSSYNSTTNVYYTATVSIATGSWQALSIGGVTSSTAQFIYFRNTDPTNFVTLSTNSGGTNPFAKVLPGQQLIVPYVPSATYYAEATTGACECLVLVVDA